MDQRTTRAFNLDLARVDVVRSRFEFFRVVDQLIVLDRALFFGTMRRARHDFDGPLE